MLNITVRDSTLPPRVKGDVSWGDCPGVLRLVNDSEPAAGGRSL